ncbi:Nucleoside ABC transporter, periplasmic nucleoside-binding protein [Serinicoccus hydrothermalis]|uniref:Nucleoside ABC transporter, periplasmic nucleoside-binding protein n=1 Tax=Serinicoccus hydrothermalis TaxID=1758689 RepID=A0A1B1NGD8_9MICO|nr:BMP family ABC transporter substrate-binding protein [Serinicoccus hydrothermalis]ANS80488.1 Nucleoside ABC transporter, periplasmic nucleoside-binding protein [Serinicoccus hydrothermalis]
MRRVLKLATAGAAATLVLAACGEAPTEDESNAGGDSADSSEGGDSAAASDFKACMVSDAGGFDDQSFNQSGKEGLDAAAEALDVEAVEVESQADTDYATNVAGLVDQGCSITIGVGFLLEDAIQTAAEDNPDTNFALIDSAFTDAANDNAPIELDNAKPILFNTAEASFLAGYLSAGMTETGTVATFGGLQIPSVSVFMDGFADGVAKFNEDNGADVELLGWDKEAQQGSFSGDFDNQSQGQTLTEQFISQGADIVMPVAGPVGLGAAAAAEGADGVKIVWVDSDGYLTASEYSDLMLTSVLKQIGPAVEQTVTDTVNGGFSNEPYVGTLENDGVGLAPYHDMEGDVTSTEVTGPDGETMTLDAAVEMLREQIISGDLVVESTNSPQQ